MTGRLRRYFQYARYRAVVRVARLIRRQRATGDSPVFRPVLVRADEPLRVLSLSPHPDDDILAVGGTLTGHVHAGGSVYSVVLTDGSRGTPHSERNPESVAVRRRETIEAASILEIPPPEFWALPDGALVPDEKSAAKLARLIVSIEPDVIYVPFPVDYHPDHLAAGRLLVRSLRRIPFPVTLRCYECIIPLLPNLIIDITRYADKKRDAVACFVSQNNVSDYVYTILEGLNRLRTHGLMRGRGYAEAVFETPVAFFDGLLSEMES